MSEHSEPTLESLRAQGAHRHDPARFHYLEVLERRALMQPTAVRQELHRRLQAAVASYAERATPGAVALRSPPVKPDPISPLAQLNQDLRAQDRSLADSVLTSDSASLSDMKSVRQFSDVWSKISAEQQVVRALSRGPENAGPLNSHKLMLRSLALMHALSPDYLRRFLSQVDSLLWLDQANTKTPGSPAPPARKRRDRH